MKYFILGLFLLSVSCSSVKKARQGELLDSAVESSDISSEAQGSDSGNIDGLSTIYFAYDQSRLTARTRRTLSQNASWIQSSGKVVQLEGHCDYRGSSEYNLALGERRAIAVKNYLVSLGVDRNQLTVISYGEEKPLSYGESESDFRKNRRVNFVPLD